MEWAGVVMDRLGYLGLSLIVLLENLLPPIPSELILPFAGFRTATGSFTLPGVIAAATLGSVLGALLLYRIGFLVGKEPILRFVAKNERWLTVGPKHIHQANNWFKKYGPWAVFLCRMVPIMRSLISIPAGLVHMPLLPFVGYTLLGSLIWNSLLIGLGAILGANWSLVAEWLTYYRNLLIAVVAVAAIYLGIRHLIKRRAEES